MFFRVAGLVARALRAIVFAQRCWHGALVRRLHRRASLMGVALASRQRICSGGRTVVAAQPPLLIGSPPAPPFRAAFDSALAAASPELGRDAYRIFGRGSLALMGDVAVGDGRCAVD